MIIYPMMLFYAVVAFSYFGYHAYRETIKSDWEKILFMWFVGAFSWLTISVLLTKTLEVYGD